MGAAAVITAVGTTVPETVLTNEELASQILGAEAEWIRTRTGVLQRHVIASGEATSDLAVEAGQKALAAAGSPPVDAVLVATSTPDQLIPSIAPEVAARLGLGMICAFDVGAACTGFVYALAAGAGLIAAGTAGTVLVIGADTYSTALDPLDLATRAIFGDGAGAVVLQAGIEGEPGALSGLHLGSDGANYRMAGIYGGGSRVRSTGLAIEKHDLFVRMEGRAVFANAVERMSESIRATADRMDWTLDDVDRLVLHQANTRILAAVARALEVPFERFVTNIAEVGNTVAASIPLAMDAGIRSGELLPGQRVVLAGFGGGLTWGSVALTWPELP